MGNKVSADNFHEDLVHYIIRLGLNGRAPWTAMDLCAAAGICRRIRSSVLDYTGKINVTAPLCKMLEIDPFGADDFLRRGSFGDDCRYHASPFSHALVEFGNSFKKQKAVDFTVRIVVKASTPRGALTFYSPSDSGRVNERDIIVDFESLPQYEHFAYDIQANRWEDLLWTNFQMQSSRFVEYLNGEIKQTQLWPLVHGCNNIPFTINGDLELLKIIKSGIYWENRALGVAQIETRLSEYLELPWVFGASRYGEPAPSPFLRKQYLRHKTAILYDGMLFPTVKKTGIGKFDWLSFWSTANVETVRFYILGVNIRGGAGPSITDGGHNCPEFTSGEYRMGVDIFERMEMLNMAPALAVVLKRGNDNPCPHLKKIEFIAPKIKREREEIFQYFQSLRYDIKSKDTHCISEEVLCPSATFHTLINITKWEERVFSCLEDLSREAQPIEVIRPKT